MCKKQTNSVFHVSLHSTFHDTFTDRFTAVAFYKVLYFLLTSIYFVPMISIDSDKNVTGSVSRHFTNITLFLFQFYILSPKNVPDLYLKTLDEV